MISFAAKDPSYVGGFALHRCRLKFEKFYFEETILVGSYLGRMCNKIRLSERVLTSLQTKLAAHVKDIRCTNEKYFFRV